MVTLERASELVNALSKQDKEAAQDLFTHFVDLFSLVGEDEVTSFAILCGYAVAKNVERR